MSEPAGQPDEGGSSSDSDPDSDTDSESDQGEDNLVRDWLDGLPEDSAFEYLRLIGTALTTKPKPRTGRLLASLHTSFIADFEVLIGNMLRIMITEHPAVINDSEKKFIWADLVKFDSLDDFKQFQIEKTIDVVLYGSYDDWLDFIEKKLHIAVPSAARSSEMVEIFQRRNMIMHNGGVASKQYVNAVNTARKESIGTELIVDSAYLQRSADHLLAVGAYLVHFAEKKILKSYPDELARLEGQTGPDLTYMMLQAKRYEAIAKLNSILKMDDFTVMGSGYRFQVNGWLALKRLGRFAECEEAVRAWDTSVLEPLFKLAKHALLDELEEGLELVKRLRNTEDLPLRHWLTWPLLEELREYEGTMLL
jgi:hypothetical protein